jgi:hypothetical protein
MPFVGTEKKNTVLNLKYLIKIRKMVVLLSTSINSLFSKDTKGTYVV